MRGGGTASGGSRRSAAPIPEVVSPRGPPPCRRPPSHGADAPSPSPDRSSPRPPLRKAHRPGRYRGRRLPRNPGPRRGIVVPAPTDPRRRPVLLPSGSLPGPRGTRPPPRKTHRPGRYRGRRLPRSPGARRGVGVGWGGAGAGDGGGIRPGPPGLPGCGRGRVRQGCVRRVAGAGVRSAGHRAGRRGEAVVQGIRCGRGAGVVGGVVVQLSPPVVLRISGTGGPSPLLTHAPDCPPTEPDENGASENSGGPACAGRRVGGRVEQSSEVGGRAAPPPTGGPLGDATLAE
ncbi:hypothetical protein RKD37_002297 [Streptomyces ambofaciens]